MNGKKAKRLRRQAEQTPGIVDERVLMAQVHNKKVGAVHRQSATAFNPAHTVRGLYRNMKRGA